MRTGRSAGERVVEAAALTARGAAGHAVRARPLRAGFALLLASALAFGCGYHLAVRRPLPKGLKSLSFGAVTNETEEVGVERDLRWAMEREFLRQGGFALSDAGDGVLEATIRELDIRPVAFDHLDQVFKYEMALVLDFTLTERSTGEVVWRATGVRETEEYSATPQVLVTTSPEFQRGTLDPGDLRSLHHVQFSEAQERAAIGRLFESMARDAYLRMTEDF